MLGDNPRQTDAATGGRAVEYRRRPTAEPDATARPHLAFPFVLVPRIANPIAGTLTVPSR